VKKSYNFINNKRIGFLKKSSNLSKESLEMEEDTDDIVSNSHLDTLQ